jgi:hypothetical protein
VGGVCEEKQKIHQGVGGVCEEKQKIHQGVGGVCEEKQNITKEWEKFVRKSRRLP